MQPVAVTPSINFRSIRTGAHYLFVFVNDHRSVSCHWFALCSQTCSVFSLLLPMWNIMQEPKAKCSQQRLHNVTTRCLCSTRCHALMEVRGRSGRKTPLKELISRVGVGCVKHGSLCPSFTLPAARGASLTLCGLSVGECDVLLNYRKVRTAFHCIEITSF